MVNVEGEGAVLGVILGRPIVTKGDFVAHVCESDALFPNNFGENFLEMYQIVIFSIQPNTNTLTDLERHVTLFTCNVPTLVVAFRITACR